MLKFNPAERPTVDDCLAHEYFKDAREHYGQEPEAKVQTKVSDGEPKTLE